MIDKSWKLQRYDRKDYTELVEFPVEIVGRDGVVRRYTFEDSIRLYQRRITFAPIRFRDGDLVKAEMGHCRSRIGQLRRSYFHSYGWGTPEGESGAEDTFGELAGELAAFLCRVLRTEGRPELHFEAVGDENGVSTWFITPRGGLGILLYVHRFDGPAADQVREGFFAQLKKLEGVSSRDEGEVERLLAFHHTVDCGFILAGRGNELDEVSIGPHDDPSMDLSPTPFDEVLELVRRGDAERALLHCKLLVDEQPWHLSAYSLGALIAIQLGDGSVAEDLAGIGSRYFSEDALLHWYLGIARRMQGRTEEAEKALAESIRLGPDRVGPRAMLVRHLLEQDRVLEARGCIAAMGAVASDEEQDAADALGLLGTVLGRRAPFMGTGLGVAAVGLALVPAVGLLSLLLTVAGLAVATFGWLRARWVLKRWAARSHVEELTEAVKRMQKRMRNGPRIS